MKASLKAMPIKADRRDARGLHVSFTSAGSGRFTVLAATALTTDRSMHSDRSQTKAAAKAQKIEVKGPKGTRSFTATDNVTIAVEDGKVTVTPRGKSKRAVSNGG